MAYDTQTNPFFAETTSNQNIITQGLKDFAKIGVDSQKLVITLPWYFPRYECQVRLFGACAMWIYSDKKQFCQGSLYDGTFDFDENKVKNDGYGSFVAKVNSKTNEGKDFEIIFDNSTSLDKKINLYVKTSKKYSSKNPLGFGMFRSNCLNYDTNIEKAKSENSALWKQLDEITEKMNFENEKENQNQNFNPQAQIDNKYFNSCSALCSAKDYEILYGFLVVIFTILVAVVVHFCCCQRCFQRQMKKGGTFAISNKSFHF